MEPNNITIDGVSYTVDQFSQPVQQAIGVYNVFNADLQKAQLEVMKVQAAMQNIGAQISEAVKRELAEKAEAAKVSTAANDDEVAKPQ